MPLVIELPCPSCGNTLSFPETARNVSCTGCNSDFARSAADGVPLFIPNKLKPAEAVEAVKAALSEAGEAYSSVRDAQLFSIPFCRTHARKLFWVVNDIIKGPGGSSHREPRPLLGYGEDVVKGLLMGGGRDASERSLKLAAGETGGLRPLVELEGVEFAAPEDGTALADKRGAGATGMPVGSDAECRPVRARDVPNIEATFEPSATVVYSPCWVVETARVDGSGDPGGGSLAFVDGHSGRVVGLNAPIALLDRLIGKQASIPSGEILELSACGSCGGRLVGQPADAVRFCGSCGVAWHGNEKLTYMLLEPRSDPGPDVEYLPVWAVESRISGQGRVVDSRFELLRLAPGMSWPKEEDKDIPMMFFMPAFRLNNLEMLTRVTAAMTRFQPVLKESSIEDVRPSMGCHFGPDGAMKLATLMLYALIPKGNKAAVDFALQADVETVQARLLVVPFAKTRFDCRDTVTGASIPTSALGE